MIIHNNKIYNITIITITWIPFFSLMLPATVKIKSVHSSRCLIPMNRHDFGEISTHHHHPSGCEQLDPREA
jgi:hypothetical protein